MNIDEEKKKTEKIDVSGKKDIISMKSWDDFETTEEIKVPEKLIDQVIGQDKAVDIIKKAAKQRRNVLLIGEPGTGKCVGPDTPITLNNEIVKAEELFNRIKENGWNSELVTFAIDSSDLKVKSKRITHIAKFKASSSMFRLKTGLGQNLTLTGNHPVLTIKENGRIEWISVSDLNESDWIGCVRNIPFIEKNEDMINSPYIRYKTCIKDNSSKPIRIPRRLSKEVARFLAYFISETSITRNRNIIFTNRERYVVEDFANLAKNLFDVRFKIARYKDKDVYYAQASSSSLCRFMNKFFSIPLTTPQRSKEMPFPHQLLNAPSPVLSEFLRTLFDMEGYIHKENRKCIEISSASSKLIRGIQVAILRYGIISKIKKRLSSATNSKNPKKRVYYYLYIQGTKNLRLFVDNINFSIWYKNDRLQRSIKSLSNPNLDIVPNISKDLGSLKDIIEFKNTEVTEYPVTFSRYRYNKRAPTRESLANMVEKISRVYVDRSKDGFYNENAKDLILKLHYLSKSDIYWDKVVSIEEVDGIDFVYDFTVEGFHNFLAGNVLLHNSMLANAMTELLPSQDLVDILAYPNPEDENNPKIRIVPAGEGIKIIKEEREKAGATTETSGNRLLLPFIIIFGSLGLYMLGIIKDGIVAAAMIGFGILLFFLFGLNIRLMMIGGPKSNIPKIIVDNATRKTAPFYDGTGAHAGALLGDIKHDPLQSGGLGTPAHLRVVSGLIHKAHKGVLFIDEVGTLGKSQQDLLTALQEKQLAITGRSEMSSGAMVMTDPVPCDFILIAAGNFSVVQQMHPALRSRIRGYGYEVYMDDMIEDTNLNRKKLVQFVAQEVTKDKKIQHFTKDAVEEIIRESKRKAGMRNKITLRFREIGGLIRASGDIAIEKGHRYVIREDVLDGKKSARTLEQQVGDIYIDRKKEYNILITEGSKVGRVNGLAVMGEGGTILPIVAEIAPAQSRQHGRIIATGKLGEIAKEAVTNVSALIKMMSGEDISNHDIHIQFLQTYEGVEGDSASVSVAVAVISALEKVGVRQDVAMTGSLTVRGEVLPVGGVTQKIEAAIEAGLKRVIIPKSNEKDVLLEKKYEGRIEIVSAATLLDVLSNSFTDGREIVEKMRGLID